MKTKREEGEGLQVIGLITIALGIGCGVLAMFGGQVGSGIAGIIGAVLAGYFLRCCGRALRLLGNIADAVEQPPPPPVEPPMFFYQLGDDVRGPVPFDHLAALRSLPSTARMVTGETLVCRRGDTKWMRLAAFDQPATVPVVVRAA